MSDNNSNTLNLQSQAYELIWGKILRNDYQPGQKISQKSLEDELQLGRTPIREALLRLRHDGLVYTLPQSGTFVAKINYDVMINALFIRENLERKVVAEAASSEKELSFSETDAALKAQEAFASKKDPDGFFGADDDFHKSFYQMTNHVQIWNWLQIINLQLNRFRWLRLKLANLPLENFIEQHQKILEAVVSHQPQLADARAKEHLRRMLEEKEVLRTFHDYFDNFSE